MPFAVEQPGNERRGKDYRWIFDIDLETGHIVDWPEGTTANIHYKVCDDGTYCLKSADGEVLVEKDMYVPNFLSIDDEGFGDYILFRVDEHGNIVNWKKDLEYELDNFVKAKGFYDDEDEDD